jgi:hypothetical protein
MKYFLCRFLFTITISSCALLMHGCGGGGGDGGSSSEQNTRVEKVIGPEGGTVEVTDPNSSLNGVKITVPEGALTQETTIYIEETRYAPSLPAGLTSENPVLQLGPSMIFLKDVEITFPIKEIPSSNQEILSAFYWNSNKARWMAIIPRQVDDQKMIIQTDDFGLCRWGIIRLGEVEPDTVAAWMEEMQGMFDDWSELQKTIMDQLQPLISVVDDPTELTNCDKQDALLSFLSSLREQALQGVTDYLGSEIVWNECKICDKNNNCYASCDPNEIISGAPIEWLQKEVQIWYRSMFLSSVCPVDILGPAVQKAIAWVEYQEAIRSLKCDWRCILKNGNSQFYADFLLGTACSFSIFAIEYSRNFYPCP